MEKPVIQVSSVTYAMRGRELLFRHGIRSYVERSTRSSRAGCGYNLYVPENADQAEKILRQANIKILVFEPTNFNDTRFAADALKESKTVLINFEKIEASEQIRICDFMNGACYVLDGSVKQITKKMVLYAPKGISIEAIITNKA